MINLYVKGIILRERIMETMLGEEGLGTVEIAVIIIVLIGLALLFQKEIRSTLASVFNNINKGIPEVTK